MNASRPFGPESATPCAVCDLLDTDPDPALAWAAAFALGIVAATQLAVKLRVAPLDFCAAHGELVAGAILNVGVPAPPEVFARVAKRGDA